jgi:uncharacterized protein YfdQ (DUF2303 family)
MTEEENAVQDCSTSAAVVADLVARHIKAEQLELASPDGSTNAAPVIVLPSGLKVHSLKKYFDEYRTAPERREGTAQLVELASLIDHVNRFKDEDSALFAAPSPTAPTLTAVLDYHRQNGLDVGGAPSIIAPSGGVLGQAMTTRLPSKTVAGAPRFGKHRARYAFPLSDEWTAWLAQNGKVMPQAEFAAFLEDRIIDVASPEAAFDTARRFADAMGISSFATPAKLRELARGLTIHIDDRTTNRIDVATGETTMHFEETHNDAVGAPLQVPRAFIIQIPVFRAGVAYQFPVRLKYRAGGGKVQWFYEVHDARKALDDAFREACEQASASTELPLFYGSPEA